MLSTLVLSACREDAKAGVAAAGAASDTGPKLYVLGSSMHLRKAPSTEAESLAKLRIGTACVPLESAQGEWRRVRCGDKEGFASISLLGAEPPSLEKLKAEAHDPHLKFAQRLDSALRAASLAPEDVGLRKELGELFFERNFELLAGLKKPLKGPMLESQCSSNDATDCIRESAGFVRGVKRRAVTKGQTFVVAVGDAEKVVVYRGRFQYDKKRKWLTEEVQERTRFESTDSVLEQALFTGIEADDTDDTAVPRLGQFVLDESAQGLLAKLPPAWELLKRSEEGAHAVRINGCNQRPYLLQLSSDVHGRWLAEIDRPGAPFPDERWVTAASRTERGTKLMLAKSAEDTAPQVFEIPVEDAALASLGEALYAYQDGAHPDAPEPCGSGEGPAFSGEFLPEKAMVALYGSFDAAVGSVRWAPSGTERLRIQRLEYFWASRFQARPWKWAAWREGEQEKMLFLTETPTEGPSHGSPALIGGGVFARTEDGWRLERANRVITEAGQFGRAPDHDISVQAAGERGFIAVITEAYAFPPEVWEELELLSDLGGQESIDAVGTIGRVKETDALACSSDEKQEAATCFSYDSEWKLAPNPESPLPDFVVTVKGTRLKDEKSSEVEPFHEVRTFSFRSGEYSLSSRKDVPR
ncbi:hypothetical protein [Pyxidicoccus sp. MSG2]|uniref:hypothetical protein n=1 Tax=Pyxidicoccus sp. MSG2 TaxID=2996790 RepID=UPI00226FF63E|nr:hypothetical protein [Pyxidicoccus sp. MSG2]MCY1021372.1 hypothetical protein [Pyxidicoccus sp. MSG2]